MIDQRMKLIPIPLVLWLALTTGVSAGECVTKRLPDGSYTSECPSEAPPIPPTPPQPTTNQASYTTTCANATHSCRVTFTGYVKPGTAFYCTTRSGREQGSTVRAIRSR